MTCREILLCSGERKELLKMIHVSYPTINAALKSKTKTIPAFKIHEAVLERGGREMKENNDR